MATPHAPPSLRPSPARPAPQAAPGAEIVALEVGPDSARLARRDSTSSTRLDSTRLLPQPAALRLAALYTATWRALSSLSSGKAPCRTPSLRVHWLAEAGRRGAGRPRNATWRSTLISYTSPLGPECVVSQRIGYETKVKCSPVCWQSQSVEQKYPVLVVSL